MIINFTQPELVNFFAKVISWLVQITSSIALGIVLFTLLLKLVTLPFDYFSKASMRKNNLKMEAMRPELEKLQKQYADNKDLYNQKMMALYKKNGYSMFGACLPTILTLVIFIVAINGFTDYSQYKNKEYFYNMSCSYNNVVYAGFDVDDEYIVRNEKGETVFSNKKLLDSVEIGKESTVKTQKGTDIFLSRVESKNAEGALTGKIFLSTTNGYSMAVIPYHYESENIVFDKIGYEVIEEKVAEYSKSGVTNPLLTEENNFLKIKVLDKDGNVVIKDGKVEERYFAESGFEDSEENGGISAEELFIRDIQQQKAADTFREENSSFLWVKNIWVTDSPLKHPIESSWDTFNTTHEYLKDQPHANNINQSGYDNLTAKLMVEKNSPNGFFILVVLTAGSSLLMQLVMGKSQKAQMELQTVDGQGAQTQKMMTWMMPIMMAVFAFMYTAAFSIYIIISSMLSLGLTYLINLIVDTQFKKQTASGNAGKSYGRVYIPKEEEKKPEPEKKKSKDDKFSHQSGGDFLTGPKKTKGNIRYKK